jgi:glycosyltransferase involved in cell wall biosynthesis
MIRIALIGNINNNFYLLAKLLDNSAKYNFTVYVNHEEPYINWPESDDPTEAMHLPQWVICNNSKNRFIRYFPRLSRLKQFIGQHDFYILSGEYISLAKYLEGKVIIFPTGADLTLYPFPELDESSKKNCIEKALREIFAKNQRNGFKAANLITFVPFAPYKNSIEKILEVKERKLSKVALPLIISADKFKKINDVDKSSIDKKLMEVNFIVFSPSRLITIPSESRMQQGLWKNSLALIRGYSKFVNALSAIERNNVRLLLIDRIYSPDIAELKTEIKKLGIENWVLWLKGPTNKGFSRNELQRIYSISNVVADDFGVGWFGGVALEGLAFQLPVINHTDTPLMQEVYGENPFLEAKTSDEIAKRLTDLYRDPAFARITAQNGHRWLMKNYSKQQIEFILDQLITECT